LSALLLAQTLMQDVTEFWATAAPCNRRSQALCSGAAMLKRRFRPVRSLVLYPGDLVFRRGAQLF